jgi:signal transduction histidine kinase
VYAVYLLATVGYVVSEQGDAANVVVDVFAIAVALAILLRLVRRWRTASPPARRALAPVVWTGPAVLVVVFVMLALDAGDSWPEWVDTTLHWAALVFVALPLAFLAGLLRERLHRGVVADLMVELSSNPSPADITPALARALGDPSLEVAYWLPEDDEYVDLDGRPVDLSAASGRAVTVLEQRGQRIAALSHDPSLLDEPGFVDAVAAAAGLALENARLHAELRAQLAEVRASRARIVQAGDAERRRIERNLHDGAQQRLLGIRLSLRVARGQLDGSRAVVDPLLAEVETELAGTLDDLRALARGIHPVVLAEEGLAPALETLARRSAVPVTISAVPAERLPEPIEAAAYYVTAEALANVAKHARATSVALTLTTTGGRLVVDITDDGVGGANAATNGGLVGLHDRVAALDGTLRITSPPGRGTRVHAEIPLSR